MSQTAEHKTALDDIVKDGRFVRKDSSFRQFVTVDGSSGFKAEAGRYHLYISTACPWAHRTIIVRKIKGLEDVISLSIVHHYMGSLGWSFDQTEGTIPDFVNNAKHVRDLYFKADPDYGGRFTVPILWDKKENTIVNNESSEIIRMFNSEFNAFAKNPALDLYPEHLRKDIDEWNAFIYPNINNGVYRAGFATTQEAYEEAVEALFKALDKVEAHLTTSRWLCGDTFTEADIRLFTTLVRFDPVYVGHFKCNLKRIADYAALSGLVTDVYQYAGVADTVDMHHIKHHYYGSHERINPTRVVPKGPLMDYLTAPNERATKFATAKAATA